MKKLVTLIIFIWFGFASVSYSGNMKGWVGVAKDFIDKPLLETLDYFYRNQGLVLLDVAGNSLSYSFYREQLTDSQKENVTEVEKSSNFVLRFDTCKASSFYTEKINNIKLSRSLENVDDFVDNLYDLVILAEENKWTNVTFGKSNAKENQIFMLWKVNSVTNVEIQIDKAIHQITWQMNKVCS